MQNSRTFVLEYEFQTSVCPVRHSELTDFCNALTGLHQHELTEAPSFPEAIQGLKLWMSSFPDSLFCSWGDYDRNQFLQDCEYHRIAYPFPGGHLNLKAEFSLAYGDGKKV